MCVETQYLPVVTSQVQVTVLQLVLSKCFVYVLEFEYLGVTLNFQELM